MTKRQTKSNCSAPVAALDFKSKRPAMRRHRSEDPRLWGPRFLLCKNLQSPRRPPAQTFGIAIHGKSRGPQRRRRYACCATLAYRSRAAKVRKNPLGVEIRSPVRFATVSLKCLVLWVRSQSGRLSKADSSTGTTGAWRIKWRWARTRSASG